MKGRYVSHLNILKLKKNKKTTQVDGMVQSQVAGHSHESWAAIVSDRTFQSLDHRVDSPFLDEEADLLKFVHKNWS